MDLFSLPRREHRLASPLVVVAAASAIALAAYACGGTVSSNAALDPVDSGTPDASPVREAGARPPTPGLPPDPGGPKPDGSGSVVLAMNHLYMGDTDRNGVPSQSAWKAIGLNLDGKITTRDSTDVCTLASGASRGTQADGANGIDNSWGANILPIWLTIAGSDFSTKLNGSINAGAMTMLVRIDKLGAAADYSPLPAALYTGASLGHAPLWNGFDVWPVAQLSVNGGSVDQPKWLFAEGYMTAREYVGSPPLSRLALFPIGGVGAFAIVDRAQISMNVAPDGSGATGGTIAGVMPTEEYIATLKLVAGRLSTSLCSGSAFDSIAQQIRQASDMMIDGSNEPGRACDGISFAWGFDAKRVQLGGVAPTGAPSGDPCGDGG